MWKKQAEALFFMEHSPIKEIAEKLNKSRKSITRHITKCAGYNDEMISRKETALEIRKEYKREWDRNKRNRPVLEDCYSLVRNETIKKEHEIAVRILSAEKF